MGSNSSKCSTEILKVPTKENPLLLVDNWESVDDDKCSKIVIKKGTKENPLLLVDILETLFKFMPSQDLLKLRLTSKEWNECAKLTLKNRHDVEIVLGGNLDHDEKFLEYLVEYPNGFLPTAIILRNYNRTDKNKNTLPKIRKREVETSPQGYFHRCHEVIVEISRILGALKTVKKLEIGFRKEPIQTFNYGYLLKILGNLSFSLESLEFNTWCKIPNEIISIPEENYSQISAEFNDKTPLQKLKWVTCKYKSHTEFQNQSETTNKWFQLILTGASSLKEFEEDYLHIEKLLILSRIGRLSQVNLDRILIHNLESLDILLDIENLVLRILILSKFELDMKAKTKIKRILDSQTENLSMLYICIPVQESVTFEIPEMPELLLLHFAEISGGMQINFAKTPKLQEFCLTDCSEFQIPIWDWKAALNRNANIQDGKIVPCNSLRELYFPGLPLTDPDCCKYLNELFPLIEEFQMRNPSDNFLRMVWKTNWQESLKSLCLHYFNEWEKKKDIDQIVFGLERDWKNGIDTRKKGWWRGIEPPHVNASVVNLKNLESLSLGGVCKITDFSVYFGLKRLKKLKKFRYQLFGKNKKLGFTQEAKDHLKELGINLE